MIKVFYGEDRVKTQAAIRREFGEDYEVVEGEELDFAAANDVFFGTSIFGERKIVIRDLSENKEIFSKIAEFLDAPNKVILWEGKLDKRTTAYKEIVKAGVEMREFKVFEPADRKIVFDIYETALSDGMKAVKMAEEIEAEQDPFMFFGLMVSQAVKKFEWRQGRKEKRVLKELSKVDMMMKGEATLPPWEILKSFLRRVSSL